MKKNIGIFICNCGKNISDNINIEALEIRFKAYQNVSLVKTYDFLCSPEVYNSIVSDIKQNSLEFVVVAACSPREHEMTFYRALRDAGLNQYMLQMVNIREQCAWVTRDKEMATKRAVNQIEGALARVTGHQPLEKKEVEYNTDIAIIGGGIAGITAALTAAKAGHKVYIIEKEPTVGGNAIRMEEIGPNMECAPCMMAPKMSQVKENPLIEVIANSEIIGVKGFLGNFTIGVHQKERFVNTEKCIGCEECFAACPVEIPSEINFGINKRKAIYMLFPGSVPNSAVIDKNNCLRLNGKDGNCDLCAKACAFQALDFDDTPKKKEINVGAIIVATGAGMKKQNLKQLGYGKLKNVYSALEFERLLSTNGPTKGEVTLKNGSPPKSISFVGNIDNDLNEPLSLMYALKFAHVMKKKYSDITINLVFQNYLTTSKGESQLMSELKEEDISFFRHAENAKLSIKSNRKSLKLSFKNDKNTLKSLSSDIVVLINSMGPSVDYRRLAELLKIETDKQDYFKEDHPRLNPTQASLNGVYIAGAARWPQSIAGSVTDARSAVGTALSELVPGKKVEVEAAVSTIDPELCAGCKICITQCPYSAVYFDEEKKVSVVNEVLCQGCGTCAAGCPTFAARALHFTTEQINSEIKGLLSNK